jgi:hypothetical protein
MGELLSIFAIVLLMGLVVVSLTKQRSGMSQAKADEDARTEGADVQRERSMQRRAEARAAHDRPA